VPDSIILLILNNAFTYAKATNVTHLHITSSFVVIASHLIVVYNHHFMIFLMITFFAVV